MEKLKVENRFRGDWLKKTTEHLLTGKYRSHANVHFSMAEMIYPHKIEIPLGHIDHVVMSKLIAKLDYNLSAIHRVGSEINHLQDYINTTTNEQGKLEAKVVIVSYRNAIFKEFQCLDMYNKNGEFLYDITTTLYRKKHENEYSQIRQKCKSFRKDTEKVNLD